jgi:hypothetical protein
MTLVVSHVPAEENDDGVALGGDEPQHENILASTVIALGGGLPQRTLCVENDLFVFSAHEMVHDVRRRGVTSGVTEPLGADEAFDDGCGRVNATVTAACDWVRIS